MCSCARVIRILTAAVPGGLLHAGRRGWVNLCGRRSLLQLTSFWELHYPLLHHKRRVFDCVMDPTGDVSSEQASGCLTGFVNCVCLMGRTGWTPLRGASNQNFCLYRIMYPHGFCSFRRPTRQSNLLSVAACNRIYFAISATRMDIQFD